MTSVPFRLPALRVLGAAVLLLASLALFAAYEPGPGRVGVTIVAAR